MCAIFGMVRSAPSVSMFLENQRLSLLINNSASARGRDGLGYSAVAVYEETVDTFSHRQLMNASFDAKAVKRVYETVSLIGNCRAEPTTEYVVKKNIVDQQPYTLGDWSVVHNGTIANDKELRSNVNIKFPTTIDSAAIIEQLDTCSVGGDTPLTVFQRVIKRLKGSFAILATHRDLPGIVFYACNYRPLYTGKIDGCLYIASTDEILNDTGIADCKAIEPYTFGYISVDRVEQVGKLREETQTARALVVLSGGMDSTVALSHCVAKGMDTAAIHFRYGSRAEGPEVDAVKAVCEHFNIPLKIMDIPIYKPEHSPLLQADSAIAGGEAGAEFAHEWVPARNLVMLSIATAMAEAEGYDYIVLGNNLEEAGAYPDNEPEFISRFNKVLDFAVADGKRVRVLMPVGNMMKHEIVAYGAQLEAPLHLTWSCYRAEGKHCGTCGPCHMRRTAFKINGLDEVISYGDE